MNRVALNLFYILKTETAGLTEEDETEQLRASVDFLVELCDSVSPVRVLYFSIFFLLNFCPKGCI